MYRKLKMVWSIVWLWTWKRVVNWNASEWTLVGFWMAHNFIYIYTVKLWLCSLLLYFWMLLLYYFECFVFYSIIIIVIIIVKRVLSLSTQTSLNESKSENCGVDVSCCRHHYYHLHDHGSFTIGDVHVYIMLLL